MLGILSVMIEQASKMKDHYIAGYTVSDEFKFGDEETEVLALLLDHVVDVHHANNFLQRPCG